MECFKFNFLVELFDVKKKNIYVNFNVLSVDENLVKLNYFSHCCCYVENCISLVLKCPIMLFFFKSNLCNLDVFFGFMLLSSNGSVTILYISLAFLIVVVFCVDPFTLFTYFINENIVYIYNIIVGISCFRCLYQYY